MGIAINRQGSRELELAPEPGSVGRARQFLTQELAGRGVPDDTVDIVRLALSELVTNAIVHASTDLVVTVVWEPDEVWVGVTDQERRLPAPREPAADAVGGRGLAIVAAVANDWGVDEQPGGPGKTVWFEVRLPEPE
jgi:anti-sigma regulatory factor (Ser/Thr protein kinase)